jgi:hypothetical protein
MKHFLLSILFISLYNHSQSQSGCTDPLANNFSSSASTNDGSCIYIATAQNANVVGQLNNSISESSGIVLSDGFIWTHNDSGNNAKLFKVDPSNGTLLQTISITNYLNTDWEDIAADSTYIYIGDFGNNNGTRTNLKILKINKAQFITSTLSAISATAEAINFSYSDQTSFASNSNNNFDCEAMISLGNSLYTFTKNRGDNQTRVYKISKTPGTYTVSPYTSYDVAGLITGADYNSQTHEVVLLGYLSSHKNSFLYYLYDYTSDQFFSGNKRRIELGNSTTDWQTEGVTYNGADELYLSCEDSYVPASLFSTSKSSMSPVGITTLSKNNTTLRLSPNPCSDQLTINFVEQDITTLIIYSPTGKVVFSQKVIDKNTTINVSNFDNGVYFISATHKNGFTSAGKFIKL